MVDGLPYMKQNWPTQHQLDTPDHAIIITGGHWNLRQWENHIIYHKNIQQIPSTSIKATDELYKNQGDFISQKGGFLNKKKKKQYRAHTRKEKQKKHHGSKIQSCNIYWNCITL